MKEKGQNAGSKGFSLIEVTIGILILGILMVPAISIYEKYRRDHIRAATTEYPGSIVLALQKYATLYGRYPRPARPDLASTDPNFGREAPIPGGPGFPNCNPNSSVVCKTNPPSTRTLIGTVPFAEIGLPRQMAFDGYGRRFTYAVKEGLTVANAFPNPVNENLSGTGIRITNISGGNAPNTSGANAHFVIVSHGPDGRGAFTNGAGVKFAPCAGASADRENCDNDAIFNFNNRALPNEELVPWISMGANNQYFDDFLAYAWNTASGTDWTRLAGTTDVISRNGKPVRIGRQACPPPPAPCPATPPPTATLEVWGNVEATDLWTDNLCPQSGCGSGSFRPEIIGSDISVTNAPTSNGSSSYPGNAGIHCGQQGMTGIKNGQELCSAAGGTSPINLGLPPFNCSSEQGPIGVNASGGIVCG